MNFWFVFFFLQLDMNFGSFLFLQLDTYPLGLITPLVLRIYLF